MDPSEVYRLQAMQAEQAPVEAAAVEAPITKTVNTANAATFTVDVDGDGTPDIEIKVKKQKRGRPAKRGK
jgi:hypothetical protein